MNPTLVVFIVIGGGLLLAIVYLFIWAFCVVAGETDDRMEERK